MVSAPDLSELVPFFQRVRICYPKADAADAVFPMHLFAHGDAGGGFFFFFGYGSFQEQLASFGFVVPAYLSCWFDVECSSGKASFLEALKTIEFMESHPDIAPVDWTLPYTASGHSTGARVVMMLAAIRDNPAYLQGTALAEQVTPSMRAGLRRLRAVVADHPDPMYDEGWNPDVHNYDITETPVFVITGSNDYWIEPMGSGWKDFDMITTPDKVFINVHGAGHLEPNLEHAEGPFVADFARAFGLNDTGARARIYGNGSESLQNTLPLAKLGDYNLGHDKVAFLACSQTGPAVPAEYAEYCGRPVANRSDDRIITA